MSTDERHARFADRGRLRVAITGATGLVGSALADFLRAAGHEVLRVTRRRSAVAGEIHWDPEEDQLEASRLEGIDALVNLAGEPVSERWTSEHKRAIRDSRVNGTALLANALATLEKPPRVFVNASAVGYYGDRGDELLDETSAPGVGFLAEVAQQWEAATTPAVHRGVRVVIARLGVVLSPRGGALAKLLPVFRLGAGGRIGAGQRWMSTIALDDVVGAMHFALFTDALAGPANFTSPDPVRNADFAHLLAAALHRPSIATVPDLALRLMFGQMAEETLLASQRALPRALEAAGFQFRHPKVQEQMAFELARG